MTMRAPCGYEKFSGVQRITWGPMATTEADGCNGAWRIKLKGQASTVNATVITSNGEGWEHLSVVLERGLPTWDMMQQLKELFWEPEDCVIQIHAPRSQHVNNHSRCLHLWRCTKYSMPMPETWMVGYRELGTIA